MDVVSEPRGVLRLKTNPHLFRYTSFYFEDKPIWRIPAAVLAGYVFIGVLVVITDQIFNMVIPGFKLMTMPPIYYFAISLFTDFVYSIAGGYLCAWIARERAWRATITLMIVGDLIGLAAQIKLWAAVPHWYAVALLVLFPIGVWFGWKLFAQRTRQFSSAA